MNEYMMPLEDVIGGLLGVDPKEVQGQNNLSCEYYRQQLLLKVLGVWNYQDFLIGGIMII